MTKKIKIIDLINMQYKKEKMPKNIRIKYSLIFDYYTYNEEIKWYETADKTTILDVFQNLDYEVEILEDNTEEIEELETVGYITTGGEKDIKDFVKKTNKVITDNFYLVNKIIENQNKLVRAVNLIRKEKE